MAKDDKSKTNEKIKSKTKEYVESIIIAILIALFIRTFIICAYKIPSRSMMFLATGSVQVLLESIIFFGNMYP